MCQTSSKVKIGGLLRCIYKDMMGLMWKAITGNFDLLSRCFGIFVFSTAGNDLGIWLG